MDEVADEPIMTNDVAPTQPVNEQVAETTTSGGTVVVNESAPEIAPDVIKEPNGYIAQPTREYVADLADRIHKSSFAITKVAHKDYVKLLRDGFVDNETKTLKANAAKLVIDSNPNAATGTYWEVTDVTNP
jgi:hypothetical protein